jgi:DNA-binding SARP family transcriptional activator/predicted ATPase
MSQLALAFLGPLLIQRDQQPVPSFTYNKARALLVYLAVEADRPHSRDQLVGLLWPELPDAAARTNLRQALADLRRVLGDEARRVPFLLSTRETIQFNPQSEYSLDVVTFQRQLARCHAHLHRHLDRCLVCMERLQGAMALYRGDFLAGFVVNEATSFEEWVTLKREALHQRAQTALTQLADYYERQGNADQAIVYTQRQLELDAWREEAHVQLMRLYAASGQRSQALRQYMHCQAVLQSELGVDPSPATTALYIQIRDGTLESATEQKSTGSPLPVPATGLVGRSQELDELGELLSDPRRRLITITGPGGSGKTRLALAAAERHADEFVDGVTFVALAGLATGDLLPQAILAALDVPLQGSQPPTAQLRACLQRQERLLVLDNYEHLLPDVACIQELLRYAPKVTLLVTARERLALQAEHLFPIEGLSYPLLDTHTSLEEFAAIQLFLQRVRQFHLRFTPHAAEMAAIIRICRVTEGMPLALELAAGALHVQSCRTVAAALEAGQALPTTSLHDRPHRHASMTNVFEHSWRLLNEQEQGVFCALSVFRGGWHPAGAEAVAGASQQMLAALVAKSLLRPVGDERYDIHELLRQYGEQKLTEREEEIAARNRHLAYCLRVAEAVEPQVMGCPQADAVAALEREHENFRAALAWGFAQQALAPHADLTVARLAACLGRFWYVQQHWSEGYAWLTKALALLDTLEASAETMARHPLEANLTLRAKLLYRAGVFAGVQSSYSEAQRLLEQSFALYQRLGDQRALARCLQELTLIAINQGRYTDAALYNEQSLVYSHSLGDPWVLGVSLHIRANLAIDQSDYVRGADDARKTLGIFRELGDLGMVGSCLNLLAQTAIGVEDYAGAVTLLEESLLVDRQRNPQSQGGPWALRILGLATQMIGQYRQAADSYRRSLRIRYETEQTGGMAWALEGLGEVMALTNQPRRAARLWGAASALRRYDGSVISAPDLQRYERLAAAVRERLGCAEFDQAWSEGASLSLAQMVTDALADPQPITEG